MANIPNRAIYGLLGCLRAIVDCRFSGVNQILDLSDLKHDDNKSMNPIDNCPGGVPFPYVVARQLLRQKYCPFLDSSTDTRMCEWVHSVVNDPQKSKPIGQCAIVLEGLGLVELIRSSSGIIKKLKWSSNALFIKRYSWGSPELDKFLCERLIEYGPVLGIVFFGSLVSKNNVFSRSNITQYINFPITNDKVSISCDCNKQYTDLILPDGNTSPDASSRSTTTLLCLSASAGLISPKDSSYNPTVDKNNTSPFPSCFYNWYLQNPNRKCPHLWTINKDKLRVIFDSSGGYRFKRGISYDNLVPKSTDRNITSQCKQCKTNLVNLAKKEFGYKVKNRRFLLLESLRLAYDFKKSVSLKQLCNESLNYADFFVNKKTHLSALLSDIQVAHLTGYWILHNNNDYILKPIIGAEDGAFNPIPDETKMVANNIVKKTNVLI